MKLMTYVKQRVPLLLAAALLLAPAIPGKAQAEPAPAFDDIASSYARTQINGLVQKNIMNGTGDRSFSPERPITRAEFIAVLDRVLKLQPLSSAIPAFTDVPADAWFYGWVQAGVELGIVDGVSASRFAPNQSITRQEAAALLVKALKQSGSAAASPASSAFSDASRISSWAVPYVEQIRQLGLMDGDQGQFRPNDPITRQETAVVIDKLVNGSRWSTALLASPAPLIQLGWQYNQTEEQFKQNVLDANINTLSPRWFFLDAAKGIEDAASPDLVSWAHRNGKKVWPLVGNRFDKQYTHQVLSDPAKAEAAAQQLAQFTDKYSLDGLNIDFENVDAADRQALTSFISSLASKLHASNKTLSVNVSPDTGTDWTEAFDFAALGQSADYVVLMAYDEHWDGDVTAGSVSSLPWLSAGVQTLLASVPAGKAIVALPFYTRDWTDTAGIASSTELTIREQLEVVDATGMTPQWNPVLGQYTSNYVYNRISHAIWLEDSRSLSAKYQVGLTNHVAGFAYWSSGGETPDVWISMMNRLQYDAYSF